MSQKPYLPKVTRFDSEALMPDTRRGSRSSEAYRQCSRRAAKLAYANPTPPGRTGDENNLSPGPAGHYLICRIFKHLPATTAQHCYCRRGLQRY